MKIKLIVVSFLFLTFIPAAVADIRVDRAVSSIAFGSCLNQEGEAPIFSAITAAAPEVFIFTGDNVYAANSSLSQLERAYTTLEKKPFISRLRRDSKILATWDDNDYGLKDGGSEFEDKQGSKELFLRAFGVPRNDERWRKPGLYSSTTFGSAGNKVQVILLDTRWFRSKLTGTEGKYQPSADRNATILGNDQWRWLKLQLFMPADLRVIVSSVQVIPEEHGYEKWSNFPADRAKLLELLTSVENSIIISGDRHHAELSQYTGANGRKLYEITSSALNQQSSIESEDNKHRLGNRFLKENFGLLKIDWRQRTVSAEVRDLNGNTVIQKFIELE